MGDLAGDANLGMESRQSGSVLREALGQKFDGNQLPERQVFRAVDLAHTAAAGHSHNAVTFGNHLTRCEAPAADGIRARWFCA
jgi:hypothetical protein